MSIATEYTRLKNAKEDIKAYITSRGITVPDGTKLDGMTTLLEQISGSEPLAEFSQMNPLVAEYMANVTYDPSDYTVSQILSYSYTETDYTKWFPVGYDVNLNDSGELHLADEISVVKKASSAGVNTLLNAIPNEVAHWWNTVNGNVKQNGTIKPTGQVRMINTTASNVRDLGGWACDGGKIKYGKLFRGGLLAESDAEVLVKQLRIKHDIDLRSETDNGGITASPLGNEVVYTTTPTYVWYSINSNASDWYIILKAIFDAVAKNEPVIFHCAAGADRTGTVACIIEAILGVSQSDIDKDFEITSFAIHPNARRRTDDNWKGLISEINAVSTGDTFRDKVINWVGTFGFTDDDLNAFRKSMIDGTPSDVTIQAIEPAAINLFNLDTANYNCRLGNDNGLRTGYNGSVVTDFIDVTDISKLKVEGTFVTNSSYGYEGKIIYCDSTDNPVNNGAWINFGASTTIDIAFAKASYPTISKIRLWMCIKNGTAITADDCADIKITKIE